MGHRCDRVQFVGEKLYLSPILDLHSSDLVSYTISDRPVLSMVTTMLNEAFAKFQTEQTSFSILIRLQYQHNSINGCSERKASGRA